MESYCGLPESLISDSCGVRIGPAAPATYEPLEARANVGRDRSTLSLLQWGWLCRMSMSATRCDALHKQNAAVGGLELGQQTRRCLTLDQVPGRHMLWFRRPMGTAHVVRTEERGAHPLLRRTP